MIKLFDDLWLDADEYCFILKEDSGKASQGHVSATLITKQGVYTPKRLNRR